MFKMSAKFKRERESESERKRNILSKELNKMTTRNNSKRASASERENFSATINALVKSMRANQRATISVATISALNKIVREN